MARSFVLALCLSALALPTADSQDTSAAAKYQALLDEYEQAGGARIFARRFLEFGEQHSQDPAAIDALLWVVQNVRGRPETDRALELLAQRHITSDKLGPACDSIANSRSLAAEKLLRSVLRDNPHERVRAQACYSLAALLDVEAGIVEQLAGQPELAPRVLQYYGADYGRHLSSLKPATLEREREQVYQQLLDSFPNVELPDGTMGKVAQRMLFRIRNLSIGKLAPEIEGEDTHGKPFKLSEFRGKVVMLTFWGHW
jgi:hypothetical protein